MDDQNKEQAVRPEPAPPRDVEGLSLGGALKALMENKKVLAKEIAAVAGIDPSRVSRWLSGRGMPTVGQAEALDAFFGTNLTETCRDRLRPDKKADDKPDAKDADQTIKSDPDPGDSPKEAEAIADFLNGFGLAHPGPQPISTVELAASDEEAALDILRLVVECLKLILGTRIKAAI